MIKALIQSVLRRFGYELVPSSAEGGGVDFDMESREIIQSAASFTMTSPERMYAMILAVRYIVQAGIPGDIVECGVWRGGSMMAAALTLRKMLVDHIEFHLFDTYEGMTEPSSVDVSFNGTAAKAEFDNSFRDDKISEWCKASIEDVRQNLASTGYDLKKIHFVKGRVESTIPEAAPDKISLLRLDTDWYESTRHELIHLFPRLSKGGVLIIDDYGHWKGCRKAVDEYIEKNEIHMLLNRIDYTGRIAIKNC